MAKLKAILFFTTIFAPLLFVGFIFWIIALPFRAYLNWVTNDKTDD